MQDRALRFGAIVDMRRRGGRKGSRAVSARAKSASGAFERAQDLFEHVPFRPPRRKEGYEIAPANQLVMLVGWVIAVPTTIANAPASMAALASSSVWMRPSQNTGTP